MSLPEAFVEANGRLTTDGIDYAASWKFVIPVRKLEAAAAEEGEMEEAE